MKPYQKKKEAQLKVAKERISTLFKEANKAFKDNPKLSNRYVQLAIKISQKFKIKIGRYKRKFCKHCHSFLKPGSNLRIRLQQGKQGKVVYYCLNCKKYMRFPYKPKKG